MARAMLVSCDVCGGTTQVVKGEGRTMGWASLLVARLGEGFGAQHTRRALVCSVECGKRALAKAMAR